MKTLLTSLFCLMTLIATCQSIDQEKSIIEIKKLLDSNWELTTDGSTLKIQYKDSTWAMDGNWINASLDAWKVKDDSIAIQKYGKKVLATFLFEVHPKMSGKEITKLKKEDGGFEGEYAKSIYNSELFTLVELEKPQMSDRWTATWPKKIGVWEIWELLDESLKET
jgi:hypothetical protein